MKWTDLSRLPIELGKLEKLFSHAAASEDFPFKTVESCLENETACRHAFLSMPTAEETTVSSLFLQLRRVINSGIRSDGVVRLPFSDLAKHSDPQGERSTIAASSLQLDLLQPTRPDNEPHRFGGISSLNALLDVELECLSRDDLSPPFSVRTANVIADNAKRLRYRSLRQMLSDRPRVLDLIAHLRGAGTKTVSDFEQVANLLEPIGYGSVEESHAHLASGEDLLPLFQIKDVPLAELSRVELNQVFSVRASNLIFDNAKRLQYSNLHELFLDRANYLSVIARLRGAGAKTVHEFRLISERLRLALQPSSARPPIERTLADELKLVEALVTQSLSTLELRLVRFMGAALWIRRDTDSETPPFISQTRKDVELSLHARPFLGDPRKYRDEITRTIRLSSTDQSCFAQSDLPAIITDWRLSTYLLSTGDMKERLDALFPKLQSCWIIDTKKIDRIAEDCARTRQYLKNWKDAVPVGEICTSLGLSQAELQDCIRCMPDLCLFGGHVRYGTEEDAPKQPWRILSDLRFPIPLYDAGLPPSIGRRVVSMLGDDPTILGALNHLIGGGLDNTSRTPKTVRLTAALQEATEQCIEALESQGSVHVVAGRSIEHIIRESTNLDTLLRTVESQLSDSKSTNLLVVAKDRLGTARRDQATLKMLSEKMSLTRERVRQLESKVIDTIRASAVDRYLNYFLDQAQQRLLHGVRVEDSGVVLRSSLDTLNVDWRLLALTRISFGSECEFFDACFQNIGPNWYVGTAPLEELQPLRFRVRAFLERIRLPISLNNLATFSGIDSNTLRVLLTGEQQIAVIDELVLPTTLTAKSRHKHAAIFRALRDRRRDRAPYSRPERIAELIPDFNGKADRPEDIGRIANKIQPAVVNVYENVWTCLPEFPCRSESRAISVSPWIEPKHKRETTGDSLATIIMDILKEYGPLRFNQISEKVMAKVDERYSPASLGPVMLLSPLIVPVLPGIYGLTDHIPVEACQEFIAEKGIDEQQIMALLFGKRSGAHQQTPYPFWNPVLELAVCEHLRQAQNTELLNDVVSVCDIESWQASDTALAFWRGYRSRHGKSRIGRPLDRWNEVTLPDFRHVLSALVMLADIQEIGWVACNRIAGTRIDSAAGTVLLGILCGIGALEPQVTWMEPHSAQEKVAKLLEDVVRLEYSNGSTPNRKLIELWTMHHARERSVGWFTARHSDNLSKRIESLDDSQQDKQGDTSLSQSREVSQMLPEDGA